MIGSLHGGFIPKLFDCHESVKIEILCLLETKEDPRLNSFGQIKTG